MKRLVFALISVLVASPLSAGVIRYTAKHAVKPVAKVTIVPAAKASSYPARHPKRSAKFVSKIAY